MRLSECSYVVVDCETTGFHPSAHHRIVELALVHVGPVDANLEPWCTLLRPDRDLGPTEVHGLRGRDLLDAPSFDEVVGEVLERLAGHVVVAHNARFDLAFLEHELRRAGVDVAPLPGLCTMELAGLLGAGGRLRLEDCCRDVGVDHEPSHTAAGDALACAQLLLRYLPILTGGAMDDLTALGCPEPRPPWTWPRDERRAACKQRSERLGPRKEPTFLGRLVEAADVPVGTDATQVAPYIDILERVLEDRRLSPSEQEDLAATAAMLGLTANRLRTLHADYVGTLIALAYRDGVVSDREREDLDVVSEALGVGGVEEALRRIEALPSRLSANAHATLAGKTVCFTGALLCCYEGAPLTRERAEGLAAKAGLVVVQRVTKSLDVLVVADPNSMSGKAEKARQYGTRIVAETAFWPMIGVEIE